MIYSKMPMFAIIKRMYPIVILAAGKSTRMGSLKPFVRLNNGLTILEYLVYHVKKVTVSEIVVVLNNQGLEQLSKLNSAIENELIIALNEFPEEGRFLSIKKGISILGDTPVFIQNIDNLYVDGALMYKMYELLKPETYVVPQFNGLGGHPVLISSAIANAIKQEKKNDEDLRKYLNRFQKITCPCSSEQILLNINTQEDLEKYQQKGNNDIF